MGFDGYDLAILGFVFGPVTTALFVHVDLRGLLMALGGNPFAQAGWSLDMDGLLGLTGVLFFALLPGLTWVRRRAGLEFVAWLGRVCAVSIALNSFVVMLLTLTNTYSRTTALGWCLVLVFLSFLPGRLKMNRAGDPENGAAVPGGTPGRWGLVLLPILLVVAYQSLFLPFFSWDAIASWNRWARNFAVVPGFFYDQHFFYPLYMSWGMSFPYMTSGNVEADYFSHGLSLAHILVLYAGVHLLCRELVLPAWFPFVAIFLTLPVAAFSGTGYADIPSTAFALIAVGLFLRSVRQQTQRPSLWTAFLAGLAAGTSFLFKQSAFVLVALVAVCVLFVGHRKSRSARLKLSLLLAGGFCILILPWAVSSQTILAGSRLQHVLVDIHGGLSRLEIIQRGMSNFLSSTSGFASPTIDALTLLLFVLFLLVAVTKSQLCRVLAVSGLGLFFIWLNTANYDTRGAMIVFVLMVLLACKGFYDFIRSTVSETAARRLAAIVSVLLVGGFVLMEIPGATSLKMDWQPGREWYKVRPLTGREEKLSILFKGYADFARWKAQNPNFSGTLWANPVYSASLDPTLKDGGGMWNGGLFYRRHWAGKPGDVLLLGDWNLDRPVPRAFAEAGSMPNQTWSEWLQEQESLGFLERLSPVGMLEVYVVKKKKEQ